MRFCITLSLIVIAAAGCVTQSRMQANEQAAFLAGQNAAMRQQLAEQMPSVTVIGPVQNPHVPWVAGLTLAQAVATANYLDSRPPKTIVIKRQGESATLDGQVLWSDVDIPLEAGDVVELRP